MRKRGRIVLPSGLAGVGLALSLPPWGLWIVALPAAGLLWWRLAGLGGRQRLVAGWCAGLGLFVIGLWWAIAFNVYGGIVLIVVESLALGLAGVATPPGRGRTAGLAGAMVLVEAVRSSWPFGGLPMGGIALGQAGGPLAGAARLGGPLLLVGMVWLAGAGIGGLATVAGRWATARRAGSPVPSPDRAGTVRVVDPVVGPVVGTMVAAIVALVVVVGLAIGGVVGPGGGRALATVRVAAVQGGGARGLRKAEVSPASVFAGQLAATGLIGAADKGRRPALVLWPEDVVALQGPLDGSTAEATLAATARRLRATLAVGVTETVSASSFRNEIVAFGPSGRLVARFEKVHRVPFGEYIPDRAFFSHLANLSAVPLDAIPGRGDGVLHTPVGALGTMVSYEVFFADRGRIATRAGANVLIVPTNTASYSTSQVPAQEIAASRLQALSEGRDLIQASPTGFSAVIDAGGRVVDRSSLGRREVLVDDVHLRTGRTVYERLGDLPVLIGAGLLVAGAWGASFSAAESSETARRERANRRVAGSGPLTALGNR